jgi:3-oxoacyl-[acyl-carrier-protein] synthase II
VSSSVAARIRRLLAETVGAEITLGEDEPLASIGLDSVGMVSFGAEWERRHGTSVDDDAVFDPDASIASLTRAIAGGRRISVAGMGVIAPTGRGIDALWSGLLSGEAHRRPVPYAAARGHRAGTVPGEDDRMTAPDRLVELVEAAAVEALAGARDRAAVTLVIGTTDTGGNALAAALGGTSGPFDGGASDAAVDGGVSEAAVSGAAPGGRASGLTGLLAETVSERLGLGAAYTVGSASASGAVAVGLARDLLRSGDADEVLVVGADTVSETAFSGLASLRTLSPAGCLPFNRGRRGIALSEGAAAVLLRAGEDGRYGLAGYGGSSRTTHLAAPESAGIALAIRRALADARVTPGDVSFVNAHGPGTRKGDEAEVTALREVFGSRLAGLPVNSVKGVLWHCQGGAGVIESQACLLSLEHEVLTPTHGCDPIDPIWGDLDIVTEARKIPDPRYALSVSCGLGGVNTAIIWERT